MTELDKHKILEDTFSKYNCVIKIQVGPSLDKIYDFIIHKKYVEPTNSEEYEYYGLYYQYIEKDYDKMKEMYLTAIKHTNFNAANNFGVYYYQIEKDFEQTKKYLLMGIEQGNLYCMSNLGVYYYENGDYDQMKKYYLMAIEHVHVKAMYYLGLYYEITTQNFDLMEQYYMMAIETSNYPDALIRLANHYHNTCKFTLALDLYMRDVVRNEREIGLLLSKEGVRAHFLLKYDTLIKENCVLKKTNHELKLENTHLKFMPGSIGEKEAKDHFNELLKQNS